jgi:hypothetical protein
MRMQKLCLSRSHLPASGCLRQGLSGQLLSVSRVSLQVLVLKEQTDVQEVAVTPLSLADEVAEALQSAPAAEQGSSLSTCPPPAVPPADRSAGPAAQGKKIKFTWRIENFMAFKEIMETRKIFSK